MADPTTSPVIGVLPRVNSVLTAIGAGGENGVRLKDLADATGIARPTVHRLLQDMAEVEFVTQLSDRRYALGPALFWLGLGAPPALPAMPAVRAVAQALADAVGDTVYVSMRVPDGVRYILRAEGDFPIRTHVVAVGETKPFTSSYSGLALLATLPEETREHALRNIVVSAPPGWASTMGLDETMRAAIDHVRAHGWCAGPGLVMPGVAGIAAPVPDPSGVPVAAISISAVEARLPRERAEQLAPQLMAAARRIAKIIAPARQAN
ncbi:IclR family transcriptional regulator [Microbacterium thalassium]|uniref:DNA-binding IclR family transcriptional regulator n=1 Tax=Microbacterium thalassium TaxID=362649 RepID=A0A7X0FN76_9MICO|nr:IclR family transcriptional regulator [Microbacterium thalassium]MBB6390594.1 DNA-binding IclR family transcriptional regulator [Microbacterium thalassium]GLK25704.1 putative IclR-family regulatory protein [Microbacterium thalassium]